MEPEITLAAAQDIVAGKQHRRVTEESIKAKIKRITYSNEYFRTPFESPERSINCTTICMITMKNGFTVIGHSTPADPRNYDAAVGRRYAYENAFRQLWQLEGYLLVEYLSLEAIEALQEISKIREEREAAVGPTASVIIAKPCDLPEKKDV